MIQPPKRNGSPLPNFANAPMGLRRVMRPSAVSDTMSAYPNVTTSTRYTSRKIPPPYLAARYGKRQMFPRPTAEPATART